MLKGFVRKSLEIFTAVADEICRHIDWSNERIAKIEF